MWLHDRDLSALDSAVLTLQMSGKESYLSNYLFMASRGEVVPQETSEQTGAY